MAKGEKYQISLPKENSYKLGQEKHPGDLAYRNTKKRNIIDQISNYMF